MLCSCVVEHMLLCYVVCCGVHVVVLCSCVVEFMLLCYVVVLWSTCFCVARCLIHIYWVNLSYSWWQFSNRVVAWSAKTINLTLQP